MPETAESAKSYTAVTAPGAWPVLGHLPQLMRDPLKFLSSLSAHGDLVTLRLGPARMSMACHPDLVHQVLLNDRVFDKGGPFYERAAEALGNGLGTCPRADHRRQRRLMQPAFQPARMPRYAVVMTEQIAAVTESWQEGQELDVYPAMNQITGRVTAATMFSAARSAEQIDVFAKAVDEVMASLLLRLMVPPSLSWLPLPVNRRFKRAVAVMRRVSQEIISDYRASGVDHGDMLSMLLAARDEDGDALSDSEILDQIATVYLAGVETTASALAWALYELTQHPDVEKRLHAEVDTVLAGRPATHQDLPQLTYTRQVVDETLRRYPIGWMFTRAITTDSELGGHPVKGGTAIIFSPYAVHHRPGTDSHRFDPDRWADQAQPERGSYIPFAAGARKCIGDTFALVEATLALATITSRWRLTNTRQHHPKPVLRATLTPKALRLRLHRRSGD